MKKDHNYNRHDEAQHQHYSQHADNIASGEASAKPGNENADSENGAEEIAPEDTEAKEGEEPANGEAKEPTPEERIKELEEQLEKEKKEYLFLMAEFDNFRRRTLKEKAELIKNAGENVLKGLLPIMDDFERGIKAAADSEEARSVHDGMVLIYHKLKKYLEQNGVKEMDPEDREFDTERHEAISVVPVPDEAQKGKILDTVEKGYTINGKVLRHAKVVVGQ